MKRTRLAAVSAAAVLFGMLGAGAASAAPPAPWLPDADLFCPGDTLYQGEWVTAPGSDSLWVMDGPLAGHYVLLAFSHYEMDGLQYEPPASYAGLPQVNDMGAGARPVWLGAPSPASSSRAGTCRGPATTSRSSGRSRWCGSAGSRDRCRCVPRRGAPVPGWDWRRGDGQVLI